MDLCTFARFSHRTPVNDEVAIDTQIYRERLRHVYLLPYYTSFVKGLLTVANPEQVDRRRIFHNEGRVIAPFRKRSRNK